MPARPNPQVVRAVTASSVTLDETDWGSLITNRGGGALTVTLPTPAATNAGAFVDLFQVADGAFVITAGTGKLVLLNNAAADSLTSSEASEMIGNGYTCFCDGTSWFVYRHQAAEAVTDVVA